MSDVSIEVIAGIEASLRSIEGNVGSVKENLASIVYATTSAAAAAKKDAETALEQHDLRCAELRHRLEASCAEADEIRVELLNKAQQIDSARKDLEEAVAAQKREWEELQESMNQIGERMNAFYEREVVIGTLEENLAALI